MIVIYADAARYVPTMKRKQRNEDINNNPCRDASQCVRRKQKRMKNLTNILSYLWLLLLMAVTACSDMEENIDPMQLEEEVELTIHTEVPGMKAGTRAVNGDNLTSVTALAFDKDDKLIKVVSPTTITQNENDNNESGSFTVKVPLRTRSVHFLGNYTLNSGYAIGETTASALLTPLKTTGTNNLHYWGMETFADATALKKYTGPVKLYRDKALIKLNSSVGQSDYIAGLLNYYPSGVLVPSGNVVGTATIPNGVNPTSHGVGNLGIETYVYEHANNANDSHLYAICYIDGLFYKIAFATNNNGELNHFPIVRNHQYNININEIETSLGSDRYDEAVNADPINNAVVTEVDLSISATPTELYFNNNKTVTVTATVPKGVSALAITAENFTVTTTSENVIEKSGYNYTVTSAGYVEFTFTLKDGSYTDGQPVTIQFAGTAATGYKVTNPEAISITLKQAKTVSIEASPSATTLNYAESSVEDLLVNVTIPKEVTKLSFSSSDFTIKVASGELVAVENEENSYTITHDENATETIVPVRIRLNDGVDKETASFTFNGTSDDANVEVQSVTKEIALTADGDENVRWQGNVPLNGNELAAIVPLMYDWFLDGNNFIPVGSKLNLEFTVTGGNGSTLQVFEICGDTEDDWNDPVHQFAELNNSNIYTATGDGNNTLSLTLSEATFNTISENFRNDFLGETGDEKKIAMAIRGTGITLTKVSVLPPAEVTPTVAITAEPYVTPLNYSANSVSDLIVNVTIPAGVTTLNFSSEYFDLIAANGRNKTVEVDGEKVSKPYITGSGPYTVDHQGEKSLTLPFRLRLKSEKKASTNSAGFTFNGTGKGVTVTPATVSNITLTESGDEYVRWQGYVLLNWGTDGGATQIALPYSWFEGIPVSSTLHLEYDLTSESGASIQFAECNGTWNDDAYYFSELHAVHNNNGNNEIMGLNLDNNTGIYSDHRTSIDLILTQDVLDNMKGNRTNLLGETDAVMAIQGGNVRLKKISVIPYNQADNDQLDIKLDFYADVDNNSTIENRDNNVYEDLLLGTSHFYLKATISAEDATKYNNATVNLTGSYETSSIHWVNSRVSSNNNNNITYIEDNGTGLQFTITEGVTDYLIEWVFVTGSYYGGGDISFTYNISNGQGYTLTGDTSAQVAFTNESQILVATNGSAASNNLNLSLEYGANSTEEFTVDVTVPAGVTQLLIDATDFDVAWGDMSNSNTNISSHNFNSSSDSQTTRFKFTLKDGSNTDRNSTITFSDKNGNAAQATITVDLSPRTTEPSDGTTIWNGAMQLDWDWALNYLSVNRQIQTGSVVTLNFTTTNGGSFKLHDVSGGADVVVLPDVNYGNNPGIISVNAGQKSYSFTVTNDIQVNGRTISGYLYGLKVNGSGVTMTSIVVSTATASTEVVIDITNGIGMVTNNGGNGSTVTVENGSLVLKNPSVTDNDYDVQLYVNQNYNAGSYTLTYKVKGDKNGYTQQAFQVIDGYVNASDFKNYDFTTDWSDVDLTFNVTRDCDRFLINFGKFDGTIYIDNLKLVKNN